MITATTHDRCYEYRGMSSDTKPVQGVGNGSVYFEIDTGKVFMFDYDGQTWYEI